MRMLSVFGSQSDLAEDFLMEQIILNIEYAMHHRKRLVPDPEDFF